MDKITVDWDQHPDVLSLDEYVKAQFSKPTQDSFFSEAYEETICIDDLKTGATRWAKGYIEMFNDLIEKVEALPSGATSFIEVDDDE